MLQVVTKNTHPYRKHPLSRHRMVVFLRIRKWLRHPLSSTQDGGVLESQDEESPVIEASTKSTQDVGVPEESQVVEASTESTQDGGVPEDSQVVEVATESTQDGGVLEELQVVEASTELTQDGVDTNKSNERKSPIVKKTNIDGNPFFPSADIEDDFDCFVVNTHDASFEMDALD